MSGCCCLLQHVHTVVRVLYLVAECSHCCQGVVACCSLFTLLSGCLCLLQHVHTVVRVLLLVAACSHSCQGVVSCCRMFTLSLPGPDAEKPPPEELRNYLASDLDALSTTDTESVTDSVSVIAEGTSVQSCCHEWCQLDIGLSLTACVPGLLVFALY